MDTWTSLVHGRVWHVPAILGDVERKTGKTIAKFNPRLEVHRWSYSRGDQWDGTCGVLAECISLIRLLSDFNRPATELLVWLQSGGSDQDEASAAPNSMVPFGQNSFRKFSDSNSSAAFFVGCSMNP